MPIDFVLRLGYKSFEFSSKNDLIFTLAIPRYCLTKNLVMHGNDLSNRSGHSYLAMCGF